MKRIPAVARHRRKGLLMASGSAPSGGEPSFTTGPYLFDTQAALDAYTGTVDQMTSRIASPPGVLPMLEAFPIAADSGPAPTASIITGLQGTGQALRASYNSLGSGQVVSYNTLPKGPGNMGSYNAATQAFTLQFFFRISVGGRANAIGWKWCEMWHASGLDRTQVSLTEFAAPFAGEPCFHLNPISVGQYGFQPVRPTWEDVNDGLPHRMTVLYQTNTTYAGGGTSSRDGICRVWIYGTKVVDISAAAAGVTPPGGVKVWCTLAEVDQITNRAVEYVAVSQYHNGTFTGYDEDFDRIRCKAIARTT